MHHGQSLIIAICSLHRFIQIYIHVLVLLIGKDGATVAPGGAYTRCTVS
jgi:hypothetical protein